MIALILKPPIVKSGCYNVENKMVKPKYKALMLVCLMALLLRGPGTSQASKSSLEPAPQDPKSAASIHTDAAEVEETQSILRATTTAVSPESTEPARGKATVKQRLDERTTKIKLPSRGVWTVTDITQADELATDRHPNTGMASPETDDASASMTEWEMGQDGESFQNNVGEEPANVRDPTLGKASPIGINEFIALVYEHNQKIIVEELEWRISKEMINRAYSIFEPELTNSYQHIYNHKPNTAEEILRRGFKEDFEEENHLTHAAIKGLLPTGGQLSFSYLFDNLNNNISGNFSISHGSKQKRMRKSWTGTLSCAMHMIYERYNKTPDYSPD